MSRFGKVFVVLALTLVLVGVVSVSTSGHASAQTLERSTATVSQSSAPPCWGLWQYNAGPHAVQTYYGHCWVQFLGGKTTQSAVSWLFSLLKYIGVPDDLADMAARTLTARWSAVASVDRGCGVMVYVNSMQQDMAWSYC